ncbi:MAG: hypothetical protein M1819_004823 [Sarea resinae]|nr:MAG: hypothetical protein M1819_004823 [Sarea resinae]
MWRRLQTSSRSRTYTIGHPVFIETSLDKDTLDRIPNVSDFHSEATGSEGYTSPTQSDSETFKILPPLPFVSLEAISTPPRDSDPQTPSPTPQKGEPEPNEGYHPLFSNPTTSPEHPNVSPSSSTRSFASHQTEDQSNTSSSPVGEPPTPPRRKLATASRYLSSIPVLKRTSKWGSNVIGATGNMIGIRDIAEKDVRRVSVPNGQKDSSIPSSVPFLNLTLDDRQIGNHAFEGSRRVDGRTHSNEDRSFETDINMQGQGQPTADFSRTNPIGPEKFEPVFLGLGATEKESPQQSITIGTVTGLLEMKSQETHDKATAPPRIVAPDFKEDEGIKPIVPLKAGRNSPPRYSTPKSQRSLLSPYMCASDGFSSYQVSSGDETYYRDLHLQKDMGSTMESTHGSNEVVQSSLHKHAKDMNSDNEPVSRFSMTTYASETTYASSTTSAALTSSTAMASPAISIINRRRPVQSSASSMSKALTRKPTPSEIGASSSTTKMTPLGSKALPQSPPEMESIDLITSLQAQLDGLRYRRGNLQKIIQDLGKPKVSTDNDGPSRSELRTSIDGLEAELAEVIRDEHGVGLRLHRAWKRRDNEELGGPTSLWIRRVTG